MIATVTKRLPPRRLLAIAAALSLIGGQAEGQNMSQLSHPKSSLTGEAPPCPLGSFYCLPRPYNFAVCRPNAMLEFYDPTLPKDTTQREKARTYARAEQFDSSNQTTYHMSGSVFLEHSDQRIQSDVADYNNDTTDYDARGNVRYQEAGQLITADHMSGNTDANHSVALGNVRYQMLQSHGNGSAVRSESLDDQHSVYYLANYSNCDIGHHWWEFRGKTININKDTGLGVAHDATFLVGGMPVMWLPVFSFPVDNRRQSGFLFPTFGNSSRSGYEISAPYYFNLAPNYDATLDPRIYSGRGEMLSGEFRYLTSSSHGILDFDYMPHDNGVNDVERYQTVSSTQGDDRWLIRYLGTTHLWSSWSLVANINRSSDQNFLYDFGSDLYTSSLGTLTSSAYVVGGGKWWNASIGADIYQNVQADVPNAYTQYNRLPRFTLNLNVPLNRWLEFGMNNEAVAFRNNDSMSGLAGSANPPIINLQGPDAVQGERLDLYPYLAADFGGSSWFVKPKLAYRYTAYDLDSGYQSFGYFPYTLGKLPTGITSPYNTATPSRSLPIASLDSGLIFERDASLFGSSYTQTLEPRLFYLYVPYRNQNNLPVFDSGLNTFNYWSLFSPNQYSGADRQSNANNLTAAITTRLLDDSGVQRLSASLGQIRYFSPQQVTLPNMAQTNYGSSDYVAQLDMQLDDRWKLSSTYEWNPQYHRADIGEVEVQTRLKNDGILNFSYRYDRNQTGTYLNSMGQPISFYPIGLSTPTNVKGTLVAPGALLEQYNVSFSYPVSESWRLLGSWTWSVIDHRTIESLEGVEYDTCCVTLRLVNRQYVSGFNVLDPTAPPGRTDNTTMLEVVFKGIGSSSSQTDQLLRNDIPGYQ